MLEFQEVGNERFFGRQRPWICSWGDEIGPRLHGVSAFEAGGISSFHPFSPLKDDCSLYWKTNSCPLRDAWQTLKKTTGFHSGENLAWQGGCWSLNSNIGAIWTNVLRMLWNGLARLIDMKRHGESLIFLSFAQVGTCHSGLLHLKKQINWFLPVTASCPVVPATTLKAIEWRQVGGNVGVWSLVLCSEEIRTSINLQVSDFSLGDAHDEASAFETPVGPAMAPAGLVRQQARYQRAFL